MAHKTLFSCNLNMMLAQYYLITPSLCASTISFIWYILSFCMYYGIKTNIIRKETRHHKDSWLRHTALAGYLLTMSGLDTCALWRLRQRERNQRKEKKMELNYWPFLTLRMFSKWKSLWSLSLLSSHLPTLCLRIEIQGGLWFFWLC